MTVWVLKNDLCTLQRCFFGFLVVLNCPIARVFNAAVCFILSIGGIGGGL